MAIRDVKKFILYHAKECITRDSAFYNTDGKIFNRNKSLDAFAQGNYEKVHVFALEQWVSDVGMCDWIYAKTQNVEDQWQPHTRSTMVGDIIKFEDGSLYICAMFGFDKLR